MTCSSNSNVSPALATSEPRGRKRLTDYSRFKAEVRPGESRPRPPPTNHRNCSRSRSHSRSRRPMSSIDIYDDQFAKQRRQQLEQQVERIQIEVESQHDERKSERRYPSRQNSDVSLTLSAAIDLMSDDDEDDEEEQDKKLDVSDPSLFLHHSMPMLGLRQAQAAQVSFPIKRGEKANSNSTTLTDFGMQDQRRINLAATRATTEDLRKDMNRALRTRRNRVRRSSSFDRNDNSRSKSPLPPRSKTTPANLFVNAAATAAATAATTISVPAPHHRKQRSKSMGYGTTSVVLDADADEAEPSTSVAAAPQEPRSSLRRFRRQRNSATAHTTTTEDAKNWHNSTGQLDIGSALLDVTSPTPTKQPRRSFRKSKSSVGSATLPLLTAAQKGTLPTGSESQTQTIRYTTTRGKNNIHAIQELGGSNHGFLTGSRIKRTIHN